MGHTALQSLPVWPQRYHNNRPFSCQGDSGQAYFKSQARKMVAKSIWDGNQQSENSPQAW